MKSNVKGLIASAVVAVLAWPLLVSTSYAADNDADLRQAAQQTLTAKMGDNAKDIEVSVNHGVATLTGWTLGPAQEAQARALVSRVPGMVQSYSTVHTWSSDGNT